MEEIEEMWQKFAAMRFPRGCGGREVAGICLATTDTFAAGCVHTFVDWDGRLDEQRMEILQRCVGKLETVVPLLNYPERAYFDFLLHMARKTLQHVT
jgi:predicted Fe-S protein YdhL (DUF1289 family)